LSDESRTPDWAELVRRVHDADAAAEDEFARFFHARIVALVAIRLGDRDAAQDIAQETLVAALSAVRAGAIRDPHKLPAFVAGTARNLINGHVRARRRDPKFVPLSAESASFDPGIAEDRERKSLLAALFGRLKLKDRKILLLTLVEAMNPREIARRLQLRPENVRTRKSRALKTVIREMARLSRKALGRPPDRGRP
jgi:RNA polymerase sigma factor (sigma-70 family)